MHDDDFSGLPRTKAGKGQRKIDTKLPSVNSRKGKEKEVGYGSDVDDMDDMDDTDDTDDEDDVDNASNVKLMVSQPVKKKERTIRSKEENAYHVGFHFSLFLF